MLQKHPEQLESCCFRWDEIGNYDIPACINYVLRVTRRERLVYIGHSMGNYFDMTLAGGALISL